MKEEKEAFELFLHHPDDVEFWLDQMGFRDIKRLKAFDENQMPDDDDAVIVIECKK